MLTILKSASWRRWRREENSENIYTGEGLQLVASAQWNFGPQGSFLCSPVPKNCLISHEIEPTFAEMLGCPLAASEDTPRSAVTSSVT